MTTTTPETKTYSTKFNAKAGAQKAGIDLALIDFDKTEDGRWYFFFLNGDDADAHNAPAATLSSPIAEQSRAAEVDDRPTPEVPDVVGYLVPGADMGRSDDVVADEEADGATGPEVDAKTKAVNDAFGAFLAADERSDEFMRSLFTHVFLAGQEAERAAASRMFAGNRKPRPVTERKPREGGPSKKDQAAALLLQPQGATSREILDLTGWTAVSIPALAKASGLTLRQQKDGKTTRYFATAA